MWFEPLLYQGKQRKGELSGHTLALKLQPFNFGGYFYSFEITE